MCIYIYIYIYIYTHISLSLYLSIYLSLSLSLSIYIYIHIYIHTYIHTYVCVCIYIYIYTCCKDDCGLLQLNVETTVRNHLCKPPGIRDRGTCTRSLHQSVEGTTCLTPLV